MREFNSDLWKALADACESPGEFIRCILALKRETPRTLGEKMGVSRAYIRMIRNDTCPLAQQGCYNIAKALDIDPYLLAGINARYKMKKYIEQNEGHKTLS